MPLQITKALLKNVYLIILFQPFRGLISNQSIFESIPISIVEVILIVIVIFQTYFYDIMCLEIRIKGLIESKFAYNGSMRLAAV